MSQILPLAVRVKKLLQAPPREPLPVELRIEGISLTGKIEGLRDAYLLRYRCSTVKPKDRLGVWIDHLLMSISADQRCPATSILIGEDGGWTYPFIADSRSILAGLLALYWRGLSEPLRFFPESAYAYAENLSRGKLEPRAYGEAVRSWEGTEFSKLSAEKNNLYFQLGFGKIEALDEEFRQLAIEVFKPLLDHQQEVES